MKDDDETFEEDYIPIEEAEEEIRKVNGKMNKTLFRSALKNKLIRVKVIGENKWISKFGFEAFLNRLNRFNPFYKKEKDKSDSSKKSD